MYEEVTELKLIASNCVTTANKSYEGLFYFYFLDYSRNKLELRIK
jgi:hypothetical protein